MVICQKEMLTMLRESIKMSWQNIVGNKMRSFLTILGILIGVMAIISLITIVEGVSNEINSQFSEMGAGKIAVQAYGTPLKRGLTEADMARISEMDNIIGISPNLNLVSNVVKNNNMAEDISIEGRTDVYFQNNLELISRGRAFNILDLQSRNKVAIIDSSLAKSLFLGTDPLDEDIIVNGATYSIVGILNPDSVLDVMSSMSGSSDDGKVLIPYTTAMRMAGVDSITSFEVLVDDTLRTNEVIDELKIILNQAFNYKDDSYTIINLDSLLEVMETMQGMMKTLLAGIASISLLVGGIGIMNMMLVSVTERTTEIGLRKALGADPTSIQLQFLIESIFLSLLGGIIGLALGLGISYIASDAIGYDFEISSLAVSLGLGFSAAIGIIFGWAPARKASLLNPIDALRSV